MTAFTVELSPEEISGVIEKYGIDIKSTRERKSSFVSATTHIYELTNEKFRTARTFIVETDSGNKIVSHPSLVGSYLNEKCSEAAAEVVRATPGLTGINDFPPKHIIYFGILRAGPYYNRKSAYELIKSTDLSVVTARVRYKDASKGNHTEERVPEIVESTVNMRKLPHNAHLYVMVDDTGASGKTFDVALRRLANECTNVGSTIDEMDVYGFESGETMRVLKGLEEDLDTKINTFAIGAITGLRKNGYDMPILELSDCICNSIVDRETLGRLLPSYAPVMDKDTVGDWSARFFDIETHLKDTIAALEYRMAEPRFNKKWQQVLAKQEMKNLQNSLENYKKYTKQNPEESLK